MNDPLLAPLDPLGYVVADRDDADDPGVRTEIIEGVGKRDLIAHGIAAARAWHGADPLRIIDACAASVSAAAHAFPVTHRSKA